MVARWPKVPQAWVDPQTERQFSLFLGVIATIREIRARQNVPPKTRINVAVRTAAETAALLEPMRPAIESMTSSAVIDIGPAAVGASGAATAGVAGIEIFVDMADLIDVGAEIVRLGKENDKLAGLIQAKQAKLSDEKFAARAPAAVVQKEREQLAEMEERLAKGMASLAELQSRPPA